MLLHNKRDRGSAVPLQLGKRPIAVKPAALTFPRWNFCRPRGLSRSEPGSQRLRGSPATFTAARGRASCVSFPMNVRFPAKRIGTPLPDSTSELPPVIRRAEVVAFALVALLVICRRRRSLRRQGVLSPGGDGIRGRHHAVAGRRISRAASNSPRGVGGSDRDRGRRRRRLHRRPDLFPADGMEHAAAGAGIAAEGQAACVRSAAGALAATAEHARRIRRILDRAVPDAEIRLGPADRRIPVADLHRVSAVLCDPGAVHRELARPAPRADHDVRRSCRAAANLADSQRNRRSISAAICSP